MSSDSGSAWSGLRRPLLAVPVAAVVTVCSLVMVEVVSPGSVLRGESVLQPWARWALLAGVGTPIVIVLARFLQTFLRRDP